MKWLLIIVFALFAGIGIYEVFFCKEHNVVEIKDIKKESRKKAHQLGDMLKGL